MTNLAIIGGSGLYEVPGLQDIKTHRVKTPFGDPSDSIMEGHLNDLRLLFLARHRRGHQLIPSEVNYRANIYALKKLGASRILSISAVGSMKETIQPGEMVVVDQFIDRTKGRPSTFFGNGIAGHVMFADPVCPSLSHHVYEAACDAAIKVHPKGTLLVMEGPAFSTRAESEMHRQWGIDLIGMTALPEAKLAREAELCYSTLAMATDYDCWRAGEEDVNVDAVIAILAQQQPRAKAVVQHLSGRLSQQRACACATALDSAIITDRKKIPHQVIKTMQPIFGRVL